jgi:hypothetical protein
VCTIAVTLLLEIVFVRFGRVESWALILSCAAFSIRDFRRILFCCRDLVESLVTPNKQYHRVRPWTRDAYDCNESIQNGTGLTLAKAL